MTDSKALAKEYSEKAKRASMPDFVKPMLATLTDDYFDDPNWIYERKLDGERILAFKNDGGTRLLTRNEKKVNASYPELISALEKFPGSFICDGEVVAFSGDVTDFQKLQGRMHVSSVDEAKKSEVKVYYYLFDIIYLDGYSLKDVPLRTRKKILKNVFSFEGPIRYLPHRDEEGIRYHKEACRKGWEGVIAKDAESTYKHKRTRDWLKFKCAKQQEFVIGGYTEPQGERVGFGAVLVGYYNGDKLYYAGKVGTGWSEDSLKKIYGKMQGFEQKESPFEGGVEDKDVHYIKPSLVCEVGFTEWTKNNKLRHPRFLGMRRDKSPKDVVKEEERV